MSKKKKSIHLARLISFILFISLVISTGSVFVPENDSFADTAAPPVLRISQDIITESGAKANDSTFEYRLTAGSLNCPLPEGTQGTEWNFELTDDDHISLHFLAGPDTATSSEVSIRFTGQGLYRYTLTQNTTDGHPNIDYDETVYDITVKVSGRGDMMKVEAVWAQRDTGDKPESIAFTNTIRTSSVIGDPPVRVVKRIEGDKPTKKDRFVFVMAPERNDFPLPYGAQGKYEVEMYGEGQIEIGNIAFDSPGTYSYTVYEKANLVSDYTYDKTVFRVIYRVNMEDDGTLSCVRQIINDEEYTQECQFTNIYNAPKVTPRGEIRKKKTPTVDSGIDTNGGTNSGDDVTRTGDTTPLDILATLLVGAFILFLFLQYRRRTP